MDRALMPVVLTSTLALSRDERTALEHVLTPVFSISQTPQVWLDYQVEEREGELLYNWDAVEELFPAGMIGEMFAAHHSLLERLAHDEHLWTSADLRMLPAAQAERRELSAGPEHPLQQERAHDFFLEQVAQRPDQPAVVASGRTLTYRQLCEEASRVAWWLRERGAEPNTLVGIVMDKGWEQVVAAYGVLMSGAAYLPIDPTAPPERITGLLTRGEVSLLLTQSHLDASITWPGEVERLCLDQPLPDGLDTAAPPSSQGADDVAYALFTSGSTGEPKGVMIAHKGLVNALQETIREFRVGSGDRGLALTALHHDMSLFDLFGLLGAGGTLVMPDAGGIRDAAHWAELIADHGVTVWNSVPAMMEMLLEQLGQKGPDVTSLRTVFLGGDWIPLSIPSRLSVVAPGAELVSVGGPTETTLWNIWYRVGEIDPAWSSIPYGRPIANTRYHVLNERLEECPEWVTGEMYVAGVGLALGYWRDEERTAASFITHPATGERLYRTGDLGRWRPEGVLEFMGRADFQVKIRGMRIELGEIETQLAAHPDVQSAVVVPVSHPDRPGYHALTAYITTAAEQAPASADLRDHLRQWLPEHMLPGTFVTLDTLPLTANGKVDRKALPAPEVAHLRATGDTVAPRTPLEEVLAATWADVLEAEQVGVYDDFFELGGDSLLATKIMARLREIFEGEELSLRVLFSAPNVAAMAAALCESETTPDRLNTIARLHQEIEGLSSDEIEAELLSRETTGRTEAGDDA
jgi:amino acid adenylation domain-containing protein